MPFARVLREMPRRIAAGDVLLFAEAWLRLAQASLKLKLFSFERTMRAKRAGVLLPITETQLSRLVWSIEAARRRSWLRAMCIEAALALRSMLYSRGVPCTLHYGIRNIEGEGLKAHVWLSVNGRIAIGGETADEFAEVATFSPNPQPE
jgi:hypothetical protein